MDLQIPPKEIVPFGLRAMKTVAMANGRIDQAERELLAAAQAVLDTSHDIEALPPIEPAELANAIVDPRLREQLVSGLIVMTMIDGEATDAEVKAVEAFADAFGIDPTYVKTLRKFAEGHTAAVRFDLARRIWVRGKLSEAWAEGGVRWLARTVAAVAKLKEDSALANRHRALARLPETSLGGAYAAFMHKNGFPFPGEKGGGPSFVLYHDLTHVLSGYDTDPAGETQVAAFHAGARRKDAFTFIFFVMLQFHLGVRMTPVAPSQHGMFDPKKVLVALQRGAACKIDPTDGWDAWPHMDRPLEAVRAEYGIPPLPAVQDEGRS
jgi:hypothetical protein